MKQGESSRKESSNNIHFRNSDNVYFGNNRVEDHHRKNYQSHNENIMDYSSFKEEIRRMIQTAYPEAKVTFTSILKNNDTKLDGIVIREEGINISPQLYLNSFYDEYRGGRSMDHICEDIRNIYQNSRIHESVCFGFFSDFNNVKDRIIYDLISRERNVKLLEDVPYIPYLDMAVVFRYLLSTDNGRTSILIRRTHIENWKVNERDLLKHAKENTPRLLQPSIESVTDVLSQAFPDQMSLPDDYVPMYVLTNREKMNGASCMLYPNVLRGFSEKVKQDLYILPSSIHEVLLLPADYVQSPADLSNMVRDVNASELKEEEILSEHAYFYSAKRDAVSCTLP